MLVVIFLLLVVVAIYWLFMSPYSQFFGKFPYKAVTQEKVIALTFDDGPNEPFTSLIVDFLNKNKVKATFFQVGKNVQRYPKTTLAIVKAGHVIGNHSMSHQFGKYFSQPGLKQEIQSSQAIFSKLIGKTPALFRPPWLWRQSLLFKTLREMSLQPVSGIFCSDLEVFQPKADRIAKRTLARVKPGSIIIFHDGYDAKGANRSQTVEAVKIVVEELLKQNYRFVTVDKLLNVLAYL